MTIFCKMIPFLLFIHVNSQTQRDTLHHTERSLIKYKPVLHFNGSIQKGATKHVLQYFLPCPQYNTTTSSAQTALDRCKWQHFIRKKICQCRWQSILLLFLGVRTVASDSLVHPCNLFGLSALVSSSIPPYTWSRERAAGLCTGTSHWLPRKWD